MIGFANGCFDLFHEGHRHFLTECRKHCAYLIVAVNSDDYCRTKGPGRPHDALLTRMLHVRALAEAVIPFGGRTEPLIMEIRPDVIFSGYDHRGGTWCARLPGWKERRAQRLPWVWHAHIIQIPHLPGFSTTEAAATLGS